LRNSNTYRNGKPKFRCSVKCFGAAMAFVCIVNPAGALTPHKEISKYIRHQWSTEDGFPGGPVYAISQTPDGYLWIGAEKGLVRFDGFSFRLFQSSDLPEIPAGPVLGLAVDGEGNLWARVRGPRLLRYRDGKFQSILPDFKQTESDITAMCRGVTGDILFSGLVNGTFRYTGGKFVEVIPMNEIPSFVLSLAETGDKKIWIGTRDSYLYYLSDGRINAITKGLPDRKIDSLLPIGSDELWIGTDNGVALWNGTGFSQHTHSHALDNNQALVMIRDNESNVWVGTPHGLMWIDPNGVVSMDRGEKGSHESVTALFEDREGNIWVGTVRGLTQLRHSVFGTYSISSGLPSERNGPIYVGPEGRTWFAPMDGGLYWLKNDHIERVTTAGLDRDVVYSISGGRGELWLGRRQGGLTHLTFKGKSIKEESYTKAQGLAQNSVFAVHESRDGTVWAGTISGGVSRFKNGAFKTYATTDGLGSNSVSSILESSDGTMWFGTPNGLTELRNGHFRSYTSRDGLLPGNVNCLLEDSQGGLWIGTVNGLSFFSLGSFHTPRQLPESLNGQVFGIEEDRFGSLWIATSDHILRVSRNELLNGSLSDLDLREYGRADGLLGVTVAARDQSVFSDSLGRIWFSTSHGLSFTDPTPMTARSVPAMVHIEGVSADGRSINLGGNVRIPSPHQRIALSFTGLSLALPSRVRFKYRLDDFDGRWSEPTGTREAVYTNLDPGSYRFRVVASNSDGLWNSSESTLQFELEPVFWQTWWFRVFSVVATGLAIVMFLRLRVLSLTRQMNMRFEERLAERTRIARELHDTLLQSFQGLLLRFQAASNLLPEGPAKQRLDSAIDQAAQAITEGRDAVQQLRSSTVVTNDLAWAVGALGEQLAADETNQNSTAFRVAVEGTPRNLHPILRDEVYRIAGEALRNAFRHGQARRIEVEIRYDERQLRLRVRDDGKGIDAKVLNEEGRPGHWGLPGMHERAKLVGGKLAVWSELDSGTEVELTVPASTAYATSPDGLRSWFSRF
jgi:signal transduction histidine kinase/ligand-binding sensor domain-containing protein